MRPAYPLSLALGLTLLSSTAPAAEVAPKASALARLPVK